MAKSGKEVKKSSAGLRCAMWNMNDVIAIEYQDDFVYRIVFDDGGSGNVDFSSYFG